jgi:hypothetical protein
MNAKYAALTVWLTVLTVFHVSAFDRVEVKKNISEKYQVSDSDKLHISNKYGKVHINTWDKNEITVDIEIKAWAGNESRAKENLDRIDIQYGKSANVISFETVINSGGVNIGNHNGFEINYTINMPPVNTLNVENKYGPAFLDNFRGDLQMTIKYGKLKANKLTGSKKNLVVAYGGADIEALENGTLDISYSSGRIGDAGDVTLNNRYGGFKIEKCDKLQVDTRYGSLNIEKEIGSLFGTFAYSGCEVALLKKTIVAEVRYAGNFNIGQASKSFEKIELKGSYSSFDVNFETGADFDFEVKTSYGGMRQSLANVDIRKQIEQGQEKYYEGSVGSKKGGAKVVIETRYGSVRLN